ncbi:YdeI/OmpD-associated family protein [Flavivirga jejuensis]|uniref:YdeI/OmpD-associated family protein n=1 Tax=Flavivirga jejuensis TaxID=870487 RepID=A0ABT8WMS4_9FLAO|nr:YdeI/OmpD-associated family protein [Flavivirga jejuensis]MDO5974232.1 YdeI/OmpD-associated family protein [Flavivirga jejuensis]
MKKIYSVEEYIEEHAHFSEALILLRDIIIATECVETIKWNAPVYTVNNKNVLGLGAFKNHFGIWFFNGVFLKDTHNLLINAQKNKTKALRQMRFESLSEIDKHIVLDYVKEAIENQKSGKEIKPDRSKKETVIPKELKDLFANNNDLKKSFESLSPYKQREYCNYIDSAKREATKQTRLKKITPMILQNIGLNDKYKNC